MAIYRNVSMSFWTDSKVSDDFSPEEKYMYLYLFTNPYTNLCGCYEISFKQIAFDTGYGADKVKKIIHNLANKHNVIRYNDKTKEVLILKWYKYNWTKSDKFRKPLEREFATVKAEQFIGYLADKYKEVYGMDTVSIPYPYPIDTTVTVSVTDTDTVSDTVSASDSVTETDPVDNYGKDIEDFSGKVKEIVGYLNQTLGTQYKTNTAYIREHIHSRLKEGFTVEDFKTVIWKKAREWKGTEREKFLRPQTLFCTKFESYLNQKEVVEKGRLDWLDELSDLDSTGENDEVRMDSG